MIVIAIRKDFGCAHAFSAMDGKKENVRNGFYSASDVPRINFAANPGPVRRRSRQAGDNSAPRPCAIHFSVPGTGESGAQSGARSGW